MASALDRITDTNSTSPAHHEQYAHHRRRIGLLVLVGGLGFFAGIVGGIIAAAVIVPLPSLVLNGSSLPSGLGWRGTVTSSSPSPIAFGSAVVDVFTVATTADAPTLLPLEERSGRGIIVSSDGWVATARRALPVTARVRSEQRSIVVVGRDRRIHSIDRIAFDPISDLAFLHVVDLNGAVLPLRESMDFKTNESLFAPSAYGGVLEFSFSGTTSSGRDITMVSSDRWATMVAPWPALDVIAGTPILDASGALAGIATDDGPRVLPASAIMKALPALFARGIVERNALGVTYRDAAEFGHESGNRTEGATIAVNGITLTSPLRGKIAAGDRITAVGEDMLTAYRRLPDLIQEYPIGGRVTLRVVRNGGKEETIDVTFGRLVGESLLVAAPSTKPE